MHLIPHSDVFGVRVCMYVCMGVWIQSTFTHPSQSKCSLSMLIPPNMLSLRMLH